MSRPRRPPTPVFDRLTTDERGQLITELLADRPELAAQAERLAVALLATVDADAVAEDVEWTLRHADVDQLAYRSGRVLGRGYVHANEAASEIIEELLRPELDDLTRRAALGLSDGARQMGLGLLRGLAQCQDDIEYPSVLGCAGPDVTDDFAWRVRDTAAKAGIDLPDDLPENLSPDSEA